MRTLRVPFKIYKIYLNATLAQYRNCNILDTTPNCFIFFPPLWAKHGRASANCDFRFLRRGGRLSRGDFFLFFFHRYAWIDNEITGVIRGSKRGGRGSYEGLLPFNSRAINLHSMVVSHVLGGILTSDTLDTCTSRQTWWKTRNLPPH